MERAIFCLVYLYTILIKVDRELDNVSLDIELQSLKQIKVVKEVLSSQVFLDVAKIKFKGDYNLLEYF